MSPIRLLTGFDGSIGRIGFWAGSALVALALLLVERLARATPYAPEIVAFAGMFALFPWTALGAKRARDRGRPWLYGSLLVAAIALLELAAKAGPDSRLAGLSLTLWLLALVDLGLMPGATPRHAETAIARLSGGAKPAA